MDAPTRPTTEREEISDLSKISSLFIELQDLKRQRPKGYQHSIAEQLFIEGWQRILAGEDRADIAHLVTAKALLSITLPGFESGFFRELDFDENTVVGVLKDTLRTFQKRYPLSDTMMSALYNALKSHSNEIASRSNDTYLSPEKQRNFKKKAAFVYDLIAQPRAGATNPNRGRMLLVPPESHADHCLLTAAYSVLLSEHYGADTGKAFLIAMSHHIHNAIFPDMGFAGETALSAHLPYILDTSRKKALSKLPDSLRTEVLEAIETHENIDLPEGRASAAADVADRVLDIHWRIKASTISKTQLLDDLELVHPGPIQSFQNDFIKNLDVWSQL